MRKKFWILILPQLFFLTTGMAQQHFRVMSYNVENLFDTYDDPEKDDAEFLPEGVRHWTYGRYLNKLNNLSRVITSAGEWDAPVIIGLYEVENEQAVSDLVRNSPLRNQQYRFVITDSEDARGIDIAMLYQRDRFKYLAHQSYRVRFPANPQKKTRDILHVTGIVPSRDTLDVFLCHFPSRRGGEVQSEPDRIQTASILRSKVDSVVRIRKDANIILMGDFNDEPFNKSIFEILRAKPYSEDMQPGDLCNLFYHFSKQNNKGTYKFGKFWNMLDQLIVSVNLLDRNRSFHVLPESAVIFQRDFMMVDDDKNGGKRPKKTYNGMRHEGGFSDHLPIIVDFSVEIKPLNAE
ncbi:MAG: endonuclease [Dysgonamonadaceae bacterium]|jgi:predicted extracellular nuclease|nr:endonuclease [Dysgonamonadaceae bacterium]